MSRRKCGGSRIDAVTDRNIDQAILRAQGHGRFRARSFVKDTAGVPAPPPQMIAKTCPMRPLLRGTRRVCVPVRWRLEHARQWTVTWLGRRREPVLAPHRAAACRIGGMDTWTPRERNTIQGARRGPSVIGPGPFHDSAAMASPRSATMVASFVDVHPTSGAVRTPLARLRAPSRRRGDQAAWRRPALTGGARTCTRVAQRRGAAHSWRSTDSRYSRCSSMRERPRTQRSTRRDYYMLLYERGDVRIHYEEVGSGFPLMIIPEQWLNSTVAPCDPPLQPHGGVRGRVPAASRRTYATPTAANPLARWRSTALLGRSTSSTTTSA